jgi:hypothetical protein
VGFKVEKVPVSAERSTLSIYTPPSDDFLLVLRCLFWNATLTVPRGNFRGKLYGVLGTRVVCVTRVLTRLDELGTETYSVPEIRGNRVGFEVNLLPAFSL